MYRERTCTERMAFTYIYVLPIWGTKVQDEATKGNPGLETRSHLEQRTRGEYPARLDERGSLSIVLRLDIVPSHHKAFGRLLTVSCDDYHSAMPSTLGRLNVKPRNEEIACLF
jgi:hypothetical protein